MMQLLGQGKMEEWYELAVIAVVVIGSVVANIVKSIAAKKQERDAARRAGSPIPQARAPREIRVEPQELSAEEQMRVPPIAPPIPDLRPDSQSELERLRRRARERQAGEQYVPPPPTMSRQRVPAAVEEARLAEQARRAAAEQSRRAAGEQARREAEDAARRNEQRRLERAEKERLERADDERRDPAKRKRREATERTARAQQLSQGSESMDQRQARLARQRDARLGHVSEGVVAAEPEEHVSADAARTGITGRRIPALSRNSLRDAIILSEILSPPLSIRSQDDLSV